MNTPTPETDAETMRDEWDHVDSDFGPFSPSENVTADFARKLERKLTAVTEQLDGLRAGIDYVSDQLTKVKEQRDSIDSMYHKVIAAVLECDPIPSCQREEDQLEPPWEVIARIREQRDKLAEALRSLRDCIQETRGKDAYEALRKADESLQSLNQPTKTKTK